MQAKKSISALLALFGIVVLTSCTIVESVHPLSPPDEAGDDPRLEGIWSSVGEEEPTYLYVHFDDRSVMDVLLVHRDDDEIQTLRFEGHVTPTGGTGYLNLRFKALNVSDDFLDPEVKLSDRYCFAKYEITDDGYLKVWYLDDSSDLKEAVETGVLRGEVEESRVTLSDDPEWILTFLETYPHEEIFEELWTFRRAGPSIAPAGE